MTRAKGFAFEVKATAERGHARSALFTTPHAAVETPTFMPVGTQGSVKGLTAEDVASSGAQIMLGNTYHLWLRPGPDVIAKLGGLHGFTRWPRAMLTDSGGFQAFSLGGNAGSRDPKAPGEAPKSLVTLDEEGFTFRSHLDGQRHHLSPEVAVRVQGTIGADIQMQLDVCPPGDSARAVVEAAVARTTRWARRALATERPEGQALFGIVQGACFADLRREHAEELAGLEIGGVSFDGLALGGFSVGEPIPKMYETLHEVAHAVDPTRPRYLMGVGTPKDLLEAIDAGVDMFDCVLPTRNARNGQALTRFGKVVIKQARWREDTSPIDPDCTCACCAGGYARGYLRHLFLAGEMSVLRLLSIHNLHWYGELVRGARTAIQSGTWGTYKTATLARMESS
ncbi:MAG: tRNA guanosine(34) transglycosylase Tgt [Labilithrix sp.]|nr:tRNA guanosine(34) transglycosylase Tgt [Labilithrix sp.]MCW5816069.1 tRNA guanosine(34) transglycosylase Tgt [Labilithrix sp.]